MTAQINYWPEPDNDTVARRLRMHMGDVKMSRAKLSDATDISRTSIAAKLDGRVAFTLDEIVRVAHALNRSWVWVLSGVSPTLPAGPGEDLPRGEVVKFVPRDRGAGQRFVESRLGESNPGPIHYGVAVTGRKHELFRTVA